MAQAQLGKDKACKCAASRKTSYLHMPERSIWYGHPTHIREAVGSIPTSGTNKQKFDF